MLRSTRRVSGDQQAKAKLCRLEIEEVAVAFGPQTRCEVVTEVAYCPQFGAWPTEDHIDIPRRTFSSRYASGRRQ
jgi:hypothetical protein